MLSSYLFDKLMDTIIDGIKKGYLLIDQKMSFDLAYEKAFSEYCNKFGKDEIYQSTYNSNIPLSRHIRSTYFSGDIYFNLYSELYLYIAEIAKVPPTSHLSGEKISFIISELINNLATTEEYQKRVLEYRHRDTTDNIYHYLVESIEENRNVSTDLLGEVREISNQSNVDSAYIYNRYPHNSRNRFHFTAEEGYYLALTGRDDELKRLELFCFDEDDFSWWMITGQGGIGKSKLCFEFSKVMKEKGWTICYPPSYQIEFLNKCSGNLVNDTLFILDYSEYNTRDIFRWISEFGIQKYNGIKIRILLIQRVGTSIQDKKILLKGIKPDDFIFNSAHNNGVFMKLEGLTKNDIFDIQKRYAQHIRVLTYRECEEIYGYLQKFDGNLLRPLYAIVLTDAYLDDPKNVLKWTSKEDLLSYICNKEKNLLSSSILEYCNDDNLTIYGITILEMATMVGGIELEHDLQNLLPFIHTYFTSHPECLRNFCQVPNLFDIVDGTIECRPLEPDIVGEYFVISCLNENEEYFNFENEYIINAGWTKPYYMSRFVNRLYQDFEELVIKHPYNDLLSNVKLSDSIIDIHTYAFQDCINIKTICLGGNIVSIGASAFYGCVKLESIEISESVKTIGSSAFECCRSLEYIRVPNGVTTIETSTFNECNNLKTVDLPITLIRIQDGAFGGCTNLQSVGNTANVTHLGYAVFADCRNLKSINLSSVDNISTNSFDGCMSLESVEMPKRSKYISERAFADCAKLKHIILPQDLEEIEKGAFSGCTILEISEIPSSVISIGKGAFAGCMNHRLLEVLSSYCDTHDMDLSSLLN